MAAHSLDCSSGTARKSNRTQTRRLAGTQEFVGFHLFSPHGHEYGHKVSLRFERIDAREVNTETSWYKMREFREHLVPPAGADVGAALQGEIHGTECSRQETRRQKT